MLNAELGSSYTSHLVSCAGSAVRTGASGTTPDAVGVTVSASIVNPRFEPTGGIGVTVSWDPSALPRMWQWRMLGPGTYVTGLEPANCTVNGRASDREDGTLEYLEAGERRRYGVSIRVSLGAEAQVLAEQG